MALTPLSGSSTPLSRSNAVPTEIPNTLTDQSAHMPYIGDTTLNRFAINTSEYPNVTRALLGFIKGKRTRVTYYRLMNREGGNNRTNLVDTVSMRNVIDSEYHKILNLEITLTKEFEFTPNSDKASVTITGQAWFYPNMNPNVGDIFMMGTGDGRIGSCRVTNASPMSWRNDRGYAVDFLVQEFVTPANHYPIDAAVTLTSVFDKQNFFGGTAALLSEVTYVQLNQIKALRTNLCRFYHQSFYDSDCSSYFRPDGLYDPHAVEFMANKLTLASVAILPKNLLGKNRKSYRDSLWARLEDRYNPTLYGVLPRFHVVPYRQTAMGVFVTELVNHNVIALSTDSSAASYLFTPAFYAGTVAAMTAFELLVYKAITERTMGDLTTLIQDHLEPIFTLTPDQQFYRIPLVVHLIDMALQSQYREIDAPSISYSSSGGN